MELREWCGEQEAESDRPVCVGASSLWVLTPWRDHAVVNLRPFTVVLAAGGIRSGVHAGQIRRLECWLPPGFHGINAGPRTEIHGVNALGDTRPRMSGFHPQSRLSHHFGYAKS
jgi:hypothetical protein